MRKVIERVAQENRSGMNERNIKEVLWALYSMRMVKSTLSH